MVLLSVVPSFFKQLYTIHGYTDGNYIPLVFMLLPGNSERLDRDYGHSFVE
jgi:hypothetical protein